MKYSLQSTGKTVNLDANNFMRQGGEGATYSIGDVVYKVCDPGKMIPKEKIAELSMLSHPKIIKPEDIILDSKKKPVGYTMRLVPNNAKSLFKILNKAFREREGVTHDNMAALVLQIYDGIKNGIHSHPGYLQIDGNPLNYMVTSDYKDVYFIDVNSFQTPSFPATAIMPSIRYWKCGQNFTELTDWYSYAIISWYMFTGIHPFQHSHPRFPNAKTAMVDMMKANVSILDPESQFPIPAVYHPFESFIPGGANGAYMQWYRARFCEDKELPPPDGFQSKLVVAAKKTNTISPQKFVINLLKQYDSSIVSFVESNGSEIVVTKKSIYANNCINPRPSSRTCVGFLTNSNAPVALTLDNGKVKVLDLITGTWTGFELAADDIMSCEGRLYIKYLKNVYELIFSGSSIPSQQLVGNVMQNASTIFDGVIIQDMLGEYYASIFPDANKHKSIHITELTKTSKVVEAKYEGNVLMLVVLDQKRGQHDRFILRFSKDGSQYDFKKVENVLPVGLNFTVLQNGTVIFINESQQVEVFFSAKDSTASKLIVDQEINLETKLFHSGKQARLSIGEMLYSISIKN